MGTEAELKFRRQFLAGIIILAAAFFTIPVFGGDTNSSVASKFKPVPPCPALIAAAQSAHIPLDGIDQPTNSDALNPGDSVTALATQYEKGGGRSQWLIYLEVAAMSPGEVPVKPPEPLTLYTSFGNKWTFVSSPAVATVRVLGPFVEADGKHKPLPVQDKTARFNMDKGFLGLGLEQGAAGMYRLHRLAKDDKIKGFFSYGSHPFKPEQINEDHKLATAFDITPAEERAWAGCGFSLMSYFEIVMQAPELNQILFKTLDRPSFWSLLWQGGVKVIKCDFQAAGIAPVDAGYLGLTNIAPAYWLPFGLDINKHPALELTLLVTAPRPPLLACGGIAGFLAENPRDKDNYVTLRVISASRNSGSKCAPPQPAAPDTVSDAKPPWGRIVMVGASVTAGFTMSEPLGGPKTAQYNLGRYLEAAIAVPHEPVRNFGNALFFMGPESGGRLQIDQALRAKPTLVTAIDFLFWFCYGDADSDAKRMQRLERGLKYLEDLQCPVIVGDIPDASSATDILSGDEIPSRKVLRSANRRLREWASKRPQVMIVPLSEFMRAAKSGAALTCHHRVLAVGKTRSLLQRDQLHPSQRGCAALALALLDAIESTRPDAPADEIRWDPKDVLQRVIRQKEVILR